MIMVVSRDLGGVTAALQSKNDVRLALVLAIEELAQLPGPRFDLFQLRRSQLHLPARICDPHASSNHKTPNATRAGCLGVPGSSGAQRRRLLPHPSLVRGR